MIPGTPLEHLKELSEEDILRTIAFFRYINPDANIRLAAGRALLTNDGEKAFQAGASATITGNMLTTVAWSYTWNGENRLIKAENAASGMKLEFDYDYMGRRIYKKVYENNTLVKHLNFVYDGYKLIEEFDGLNGDALVRRYVWQSEDFGLDVPVSVYDAAGNKMYFYHTDANKNITELSDENGGIVAHYEYSPFGSLTASSGEYAEENPFRFSSEYSDMETGLVYYNYRYYSPELGRLLFLPEWLVSVFSYLAFLPHYTAFQRGFVDSADVVYCISLTLFFLCLTTFSLEFAASPCIHHRAGSC